MVDNQCLSLILDILDRKKAEDIKTFDMSHNKKRFSDISVICSGTSSRHMQSVADYMYQKLKKAGYKPYLEGNAKSGWVVIEVDSIEIHFFKPELRLYYNLEELLNSGKNPSDLPEAIENTV